MIAEAWDESDVTLRVSVDPVVFTLHAGHLCVLLRKRTWEPFAGVWALPGVINPPDEQIEDTMQMELRSMGIPDEVWVEQLRTFDRPPQHVDGVTVPGRDPRGRVISVAYFGIVSPSDEQTGLPVLSDPELTWWRLDRLPDLAFDHRDIVDYALLRLRNKIQYAPVAFELLAPRFTLTELQEVYEAVLGTKLDKRNFRRKVQAESAVQPLNLYSRRERQPAKLYQFARQGDFCRLVYQPRLKPGRIPTENGPVGNTPVGVTAMAESGA